jgi:hypothetical protein
MTVSWSGQTMFIRPAFSLSASALVSALLKRVDTAAIRDEYARRVKPHRILAT